MINPLQIALQGLAPGSPPITISTQGLILTIAPPEEQPDALWQPLRSYGPPNSAPYDSRKKKKKRIDAVVEVTGCQGTLSCTKANVFELARQARLVPILAQHAHQFWLWKKRCRQKTEPETAVERKTRAKKIRAERKIKAQLVDFQHRAKGKKTKDLAASVFWRDRTIAELREQIKLLQQKSS